MNLTKPCQTMEGPAGVGLTSVFEKSCNVKHSSEPEKRNGLIFSLLPKFRYYVYFPPAMTPGPSVGILTLLIISRGPNYQIKSYFCNSISFRNINKFVMYRDVKLQLCYEFTT
jgi:hypothetical protein